MKKLLIGLRTSVKAMVLIAVCSIIIFVIAMCVYKPIYSVELNGEMIGYSKDRTALQARILDYMENGDEENVAFVQINDMPEYKLCFLKRGVETNDDEIYEKVILQGTTYYKYYALAVDSEEKLYVASFDEAEEIVDELKEKNSDNMDSLSIVEKYVTDKEELTEKDEAVDELYVEKKVVVARNTGTVKSASVGSGYKDAGITFQRPVSNSITSRFGARWGRTHKGLDFGTPVGTSVHAAAAGTVTYAGWNSGGYGYLVIISHGNGVQTYYGHCSSIIAHVGDKVNAGDVIAKSGNTGRSTGPHLHFEIRINDVAYNPELYL